MADALYPQECALREQEILRPLGYDMARFRAEFPGVEERLEHFVAVTDTPSGPRVIGCAALLPAEPGPGVGRLMQMAVDRQRQGEGIGRRLVIAAESRAFGELGLREMFVHVPLTRRGFYDHLAWEADPDDFVEAGVPHCRMVMRASGPPAGDETIPAPDF
jgi:N-acetylglutamate synthase-like GNAT family acetyltransferase